MNKNRRQQNPTSTKTPQEQPPSNRTEERETANPSQTRAASHPRPLQKEASHPQHHTP